MSTRGHLQLNVTQFATSTLRQIKPRRKQDAKNQTNCKNANLLAGHYSEDDAYRFTRVKRLIRPAFDFKVTCPRDFRAWLLYVLLPLHNMLIPCICARFSMRKYAFAALTRPNLSSLTIFEPKHCSLVFLRNSDLRWTEQVWVT